MKNWAYTTKEVLKIVDFSRSTLQCTKRLHKLLTGSVSKAQAIGRGRLCKLLHCDCQYLLALARHKPTLFLNEYARHLEDGHYIAVSLATIHRSFARAGLNVKQVQTLAAEHNPIIRADFIRRIVEIPSTPKLISPGTISLFIVSPSIYGVFTIYHSSRSWLYYYFTSLSFLRHLFLSIYYLALLFGYDLLLVYL